MNDFMFSISTGRGKRRALLLAAMALGFCAAAEGLYRAWWALKYAGDAGAPKDGYFSLYVVGESTAAGEPYTPWITLADLVRVRLGGRLRGRGIRVFNLARSGESVYPQSVALEKALRRREGGGPGVVLVYAGHADAMGPRGFTPLEWFRKKVLYRSMLLGDLSFYAEKKLPFLRVRTRQTFEYHLRRIVELSLESGLVPVLATAASNLAGIDPGLFPAEAGDRETRGPFDHRLPRAEIEAILKKGLALEERGGPGEALRYYSEQAGAHPEMKAYLEYRAGKCHQTAGRYKDAGLAFQRAVDLGAFDNFPRAATRQNDFIRALAKRYAIPLVDTVEIFGRHSPGGLTGNELFADGVHPNIEGYALLSNAYAAKIAEVSKEPAGKPWAGAADVFRAFSYGGEKQANALIISGRNLFNVAAWHAWPGERLGMARGHFRSAVELDPGSFSAWLGLAWAETALSGPLMADGGSLYWLLKHGLLTYHTGEYGIGPGQLPAVLQKLASYGPQESVLARVPRAAALRYGLCPGKSGECGVTRGQLLAILEKLYGGGGAGRPRP